MAFNPGHASSYWIFYSMKILFGDASTYITINGRKFEVFGLFRSIRQGFPLSPSLYVLVAKGFGYLLVNFISQGLVHGISIQESST